MTQPGRVSDDAITRMLERRASAAPSPDLESRIMASVHAEPRQVRAHRRWIPGTDRRGPVLVLIGLLALAGLGALAASRPPSPDLGPAVLQLAPEQGARFGDWVSMARGPGRLDDGSSWHPLRDLATAGGNLAAWTELVTPDGDGWLRDPQVLVSRDGLSWSTARIPGDDVFINDLAAGPDGFVAGGGERVGDDMEGRMWSSPDGVTWDPLPAPPGVVVMSLSLDEPRAVYAGDDLWRSRNGGPWERVLGIEVAEVLHGPGGFLAWEGGWGEDPRPLRVRHSVDLETWTDALLPDDLVSDRPTQQKVMGGVAGDAWVLMPPLELLPDQLLISTDGLHWDLVPRPPGLDGASVPWMARIGEDTFAFGSTAPDGSSHAIWRWRLGSSGSGADPAPGGMVSAPIAWRGDHVAVLMDGGDDPMVSLWQFQPQQ